MPYYSYPHQGQSGYEPFPQPPSAPWATPSNEVYMPWQDAMRRYPTPVQSVRYSTGVMVSTAPLTINCPISLTIGIPL